MKNKGKTSLKRLVGFIILGVVVGVAVPAVMQHEYIPLFSFIGATSGFFSWFILDRIERAGRVYNETHPVTVDPNVIEVRAYKSFHANLRRSRNYRHIGVARDLDEFYRLVARASNTRSKYRHLNYICCGSPLYDMGAAAKILGATHYDEVLLRWVK